MTLRRVVRRTRKGDFAFTLADEERDILRGLPGQVRELLGTDDASVQRLFPRAYEDAEDDEFEVEYQRLMAADLRERHAAALDTMETTVDRERLTEEELGGWMRALNELRLVLGTRLDITEEHDPELIDEDDPRRHAFALYHYLTWLQGEIVEALAG